AEIPEIAAALVRPRGLVGASWPVSDPAGQARIVAAARKAVGHHAADDHRQAHGQPRAVIVGYVEDGDDLVTLAMNGWANPEPAWWLNLQENPDATVELVGGSGRIH